MVLDERACYSSAIMSDVKPVPRTAHLISLILASKGINDAPPATIHMLLDFANSEHILTRKG